MVITAGDLKEAGINVPLLVGGAALSEKFTKNKIAPSYEAPTLYAKDAMTGLRLMNEIMDPELRATVLASHIFRDVPPEPAPVEAAVVPSGEHRSPKVRTAIPIPPAPIYLDRRVSALPHLTEIWSYINPFMLYGRHLGFKGNFEKLLAARDPKALELFTTSKKSSTPPPASCKPARSGNFLKSNGQGTRSTCFPPARHRPSRRFISAARRSPMACV